MTASRIAFIGAVLVALTGMGWGIAMAMSHDHATSAGHAHLNLLGWVSLFLMGLFYRQNATLDTGKLPRLQVSVWLLASLTIAIGIALIHSGKPVGEPIAAISSLILFADMALFAVLVIRNGSAS